MLSDKGVGVMEWAKSLDFIAIFAIPAIIAVILRGRDV